MTPEILDWLKKIEPRVPYSRVLEVGAQDVNGSPRSIFARADAYLGIDAAGGRGVNLILAAEELDCLGEAFDLVICCEMLEHCRRPLEAAAAMRMALLSGGHLIVTTPANGFPEHKYPRDYWRLMPDAYRELIFEGFTILEANLQGGGTWWALGRKDG